jgi:hypothetical protein
MGYPDPMQPLRWYDWALSIAAAIAAIGFLIWKLG